jgi:hypothetical protein
MRQLGGAFDVAVLVAVVAGAGSYASAAAFTDGFAAALGSAGLAFAAAIAGLPLPGRRVANPGSPVYPSPPRGGPGHNGSSAHAGPAQHGRPADRSASPVSLASSTVYRTWNPCRATVVDHAEWNERRGVRKTRPMKCPVTVRQLHNLQRPPNT